MSLFPSQASSLTVHRRFYLKSADGRCFDGTAFIDCLRNTNKVLWGVGIRYVWGRAKRYFFNFHYLDRESCLVASGSAVRKGSCRDKGALDWGLKDGELSIKNGQMCVARLADDSAVMARCSEAAEYITVDVPNSYTEEDLAEMLRNQVPTSPRPETANARRTS